MMISLGRDGLYVVFRFATADRAALGFVIKPSSRLMFGERNGCWLRSFTLGPLYFRTYARRNPL